MDDVLKLIRDPVGILGLSLIGVSIILFVLNLRREEHRLSPKEAAGLLESRKQYLPALKTNIINKTKRLEGIRDIASNITFDEFLMKWVLSKPPKNKITGFFNIAKFDAVAGFKVGSAMYNNLYYEDLKNVDDVLRPIETEYDLLLPQVKDRPLKKKLNELWEITDKTNSRLIFEQMMKNAKSPLSPSRRNLVNIVERFYSKKIKPIPFKRVMDRIDELLDGALDE